MDDQEKALNLTKRMVKTYLFPHHKTLIIAVFCMLIAASMTAVFAQLLQPVFDDILVQKNQDMIVPVALAVFLCITLRGLSTYGHVILMNNIGQEIIAQIQKELFLHFMYADIAFHQNNPSGSLLTRLISDSNVMRAAVADSITGIGKSVLTLIFLLIVMFYQNWQLSVFALAIFPPMLWFIAFIGKKIRVVSRRTQDGLSGLSDKLAQAFQGVMQVKINNQEKAEAGRMSEIIDRMKSFYKKAVRVGNLTTPVNDFFVGIILFALVSYGGVSVMEGSMTAGGLVSFIAAFLLAYEPLKRVSKLNAGFNLGLGAADRIFSYLDMKPSITDKEGVRMLDVGAPTIKFKEVEFAYTIEDEEGKEEIKALNHIDFEIPSGETYALVGPSGGGKSTIISLLPRFFDPQKGHIKINGQDIKDYSIQSLRDHIAYVPQDAIIFDESVAYNIAYGHPNATKEDIENAARAAYAHDFIESLAERYETRLGERGTKLSGGQKQRIAIARAILKDAPVLLLDEATSALDNESEEYIQTSLERLRQNRTTLVIAHRLSTIKDADKILVIDKGVIVEEGTHTQLMKSKGLYSKLHDRTKK